MDNLLMIALLGGIFGMIAWGSSDFFAKKTIDKIGDYATFFWMQVLGLLMILFVLPFNTDFSEISFKFLGVVFLVSIFEVIGYFSFFRALQKGKISIISPIFAAYSVISVLVSSLFYGEILSILTLVFLSIVIIGIIVLSIDFKQLKNDISIGNLSKGVGYAFIAMLGIGIAFPFLDNILSNSNNWLLVIFFFRLFMIILIFIAILIEKEQANLMIKDKKIVIWLLFMSILDVSALLVSSWAFAVTPFTSLITVLTAGFFLPTIILARIFLKEKITLMHYIGITLMAIGVLSIVAIN